KEIERVKKKGEAFNNNYNVKAGDREALISEDEEERGKAEKRKENYIEFFIKKGISKEQAEAIYEEELQKEVYKKSKVEYGREKLKQRVDELTENGKSKEEAKATAKAELFDELIVKESEIIKKAEIEQLPPKERKWYRKTLDWYLRQNTVTRLLISTGIVTGAVGVAGGFGASSLAMFAGYRFVRGAGAVFTGKLASAGVGWATKSKIEKGRRGREEEIKKTINFNNIDEVEKRYKEHLLKNKKEDRAVLLTKAFTGMAVGMGTAIGIGMLENAYAGGGGGASTESSEPVEKTLTYTDKQEFSNKFIKEFGEVGDYGTSEAQITQSLLEGKITPEQYYDFLQEVSDGEFPTEKDVFLRKMERQIEMYNEALKIEGVGGDVSQRAALNLIYKNIEESILLSSQGEVPAVFQIGSRGPQGSVIDGFRENPDLARKFGAPDNLFNESGEIADKTAFDNWAGKKAHILWLESAKEALKNEEVLGKLEELGYSKDMEGYGQMMRRISEGSVSLDPEKGTMLLGEKTDFLNSKEEVLTEAQKTAQVEIHNLEYEQSIIKSLGFESAEYEAIKDVKVGKLLEEIPPKNEAWALWRSIQSNIDMPHDGVYGFREFGKQVKLAEFIRTSAPDILDPNNPLRTMDISQFLQLKGGDVLLDSEKESLAEILTDSSLFEMERDIMESTGLVKEELALMKKVDVGYLMNELPEDLVHKATLIQRQEMGGSIAELVDGKRLPVPPGGADEEYAMKQIELARILHELNPDQQEKHMDIGSFIEDKNEFWKHLKNK
ncbi:MAG: hypothetical protein U9P61_01155, partial [Patescibacteria group bacterium]|nr:hypothetical protein [Patescibacteria group bacterium]